MVTGRIPDCVHSRGSGVLAKASNATGDEQTLWKEAEPVIPVIPTDWSADGHFLLVTRRDPKTGSDLWLLPVEGDRKPVPLLQTQADESVRPVFARSGRTALGGLPIQRKWPK